MDVMQVLDEPLVVFCGNGGSDIDCEGYWGLRRCVGKDYVLVLDGMFMECAA